MKLRSNLIVPGHLPTLLAVLSEAKLEDEEMTLTPFQHVGTLPSTLLHFSAKS